MERQAGLGRSLEEVLDSVPPVEPLDPAPTHALFGIAPDDAPVTNGTADTKTKSKKKKKKKKKSKGTDEQQRKSKSKSKKKKKKKKSTGKRD